MGFRGLESNRGASGAIPKSGSQRVTIHHYNALLIIEPYGPLIIIVISVKLLVERFRVRQEVMTMKKGYGIYRLDMDLKYKLLLTFKTSDTAIDQLNRMAKKYRWKFVSDKSLFGGYWVSPGGLCNYRVAGHDLNLAVA